MIKSELWLLNMQVLYIAYPNNKIEFYNQYADTWFESDSNLILLSQYAEFISYV
jgi:hypothetical protein